MRGMAILNAMFDYIIAEGDSVEEIVRDIMTLISHGTSGDNNDEMNDDITKEITYVHLRNAGFSPAHRYLDLEDVSTEGHETCVKMHDWCMAVAKLPYMSTVKGLKYCDQTALQKAIHKTRLDEACIMMLNLLYEVSTMVSYYE